MSPDEINKFLKETAKAFPNTFKQGALIPQFQAARDFAKAMQSRATKAGSGKAMEQARLRLEDVIRNFKAKPETEIVNGQGPHHQYAFRALTKPYIEAAGIEGVEDIKRRAWSGLIADLKKGVESVTDTIKSGFQWSKYVIPLALGAGILYGVNRLRG